MRAIVVYDNLTFKISVYSHRKMKFLRENIAFRFLWLLMALQILNCIVATPLDAQSSNAPKNLSYKNMQSIVEIFWKQVLGITSAVTDQDAPADNESEEFSIEQNLNFFIHDPSLKSIHDYIALFSSKYSFYEKKYSKQVHLEQIPPPPKT